MAELKLLLFSFIWPLLLLLVAFFFRRRRVLSGLCFMLGFLWLYLPSTPLVAYGLANYWQENIKPFHSAHLSSTSPPEAIVILSGVNNRPVEYPANRTLSVSTLVRLRYGAELARQQDLPVLTAGGQLRHARGLALADQMAEVLIQEFNIPVIWRESRSRTTAQNAQYSAELLGADGIKSIILVTSAVHMPRAIMSFERYGFSVTPAPTMFEQGYIRNVLFKLIPRADSFVLSKRIAHEILGCWVYKHFTLPKKV